MSTGIKATPSVEWNRLVVFEGLPAAHPDCTSLGVCFRYECSPSVNMHAAVALDNVVIPHVCRAVNSHDELVDALAAFEQGPPDGDNTDAWFAQYAVNLERARAALAKA